MAQKKFLIVDDEEDILEYYEDIIRETFDEEEVLIETALDGVIAVDKLRKDSFDVLMIDINMPNKNGIQTIEEVYLEGIFKNTKVFLISAYLSISQDKIKGEAFQNVELVEKPFKEDALKKMLRDRF